MINLWSAKLYCNLPQRTTNMGILSILPEHLSAFETWVARAFLVLGTITIAPWALLLAYDLTLYVSRLLYFITPVIGGHAQGERRPPAPTLDTRPSGRPRSWSVISLGVSTPGTSPRKADKALDSSDAESDEDHENDKNDSGQDGIKSKSRDPRASPTPVHRRRVDT